MRSPDRGPVDAGRSVRRPVLILLAALLPAVVAAGCAGDRGPASGVEATADGVVVHYKPCHADRGLRRVAVFDPGNRRVWAATVSPGAAARASLPIAPAVRGYHVDDRLGRTGLRRGTTYRVLAVSITGDDWGGPTFDPAELRRGAVLAGGKQVDAATWRSAKASCGGRSVSTVAGGALLAGVAAAVLLAAVLGPLWLLRRVAVRRAREREGHLPWLHDPPPDLPNVRWWPTSWRRPGRRRRDQG